MNAIEVTSLFVASSDVVLSDLPDGIALLDLTAGKYFSLNAVGAHVWKNLQSPIGINQIVTSVCDNFNVENSVCKVDVYALLQSLVEADLVKLSSVETAS
jgi:hypothetical protein